MSFWSWIENGENNFGKFVSTLLKKIDLRSLELEFTNGLIDKEEKARIFDLVIAKDSLKSLGINFFGSETERDEWRNWKQRLQREKRSLLVI